MTKYLFVFRKTARSVCFGYLFLTQWEFLISQFDTNEYNNITKLIVLEYNNKI